MRLGVTVLSSIKLEGSDVKGGDLKIRKENYKIDRSFNNTLLYTFLYASAAASINVKTC